MRWRWPRAIGWRWPGSRRRAEERRFDDPWAGPTVRSPLPDTPITQLLSEIEVAAWAVYAANGLPDKPGQYARSPRARTWRFLSEDLTVEERWALVLAQREGSGWRFGALEDLGAQADSPADLRQAADVLRSCRGLRSRLAETGGTSLGDDLEVAIGLGAAWRQLASLPTPAASPEEAPRLTAPAKPRAKRKSRAKPKT